MSDRRSLVPQYTFPTTLEEQETAPVILDEGERLQLRVFIDRSVVEVFVNGKQCVAVRVYPECPDSLGVSFRSQGVDGEIASLHAWQMKAIW